MEHGNQNGTPCGGRCRELVDMERENEFMRSIVTDMWGVVCELPSICQNCFEDSCRLGGECVFVTRMRDVGIDV